VGYNHHSPVWGFDAQLKIPPSPLKNVKKKSGSLCHQPEPLFIIAKLQPESGQIKNRSLMAGFERRRHT
jgi:hypothetical protein